MHVSQEITRLNFARHPFRDVDKTTLGINQWIVN